MSAAAGSSISRRGVWRAAAVAVAAPLLGACSSRRSAGGTTRGSQTVTPAATGRPAHASPSPSAWQDAQIVRRGSVVARGPVTTVRLRAVAAATAQAIVQVRAVWGHAVLPGPVKVDVPRDDAQFRARGGSAEAGARIAATTTVDGRIVLAPSLFTAVTPQGRIVVLTHELTHLALHQARLTTVPQWIIEGSAEYTAYHSSSLDLAALVPDLAAAVRSGNAPTGPPADTGFERDPTTAYQSAHCWCLFLAERFGQRRFVRFVRAADSGRDGAFPETFGVQLSSLRAPYRDFLHRRLGASATS